MGGSGYQREHSPLTQVRGTSRAEPGPPAPPGRIFLLAVTVAAYAAHRALLGIYDCFVTNIRDARRVSPAATSPSLFSGNFAAFIDAIPIAGVRRGEIDIGLH